MSNENTVETTQTTEDKFFGVTTPVDTDDTDNDELAAKLEIEIESDEPAAPAEPKAQVKTVTDDDDDDELVDISANVQKRFDKLTYQRREAERQLEAAHAERQEAIRVAQLATQQRNEFERIINSGEGYLVSKSKESATRAVKNASDAYRKAYDAGDTDAIIAAQQELNQAQQELSEATRYEADYNYRASQPQQQPQVPQPTPRRPSVPPPTERASDWADKNPWFGDPDHPDMTALAYGAHERLIRKEGLRPDSKEYFKEIDKAMRASFPKYFDAGKTSTASSASTVVAPASRNNGVKNRTVKLSESQLAIARQLNITPQQYAASYIKGQTDG